MQAPFFSQSLNRYSYAFNNPLSFLDPTGYQAIDEDGDLNIHWTPISTNCSPEGCVTVEVWQVDLPGVYNDPVSGEPFGHRESGPPGLGPDFSLDVSDLQPGYALGGRWNPHSSLGQAGRDVFGEDKPIAVWSPSPEMARAALGSLPVPGMSSLMAFSDPRATPRDKALAVALDTLSLVGVAPSSSSPVRRAKHGARRAQASRRWSSRSGPQGEQGRQSPSTVPYLPPSPMTS